jgi:nucleoside phosphorylase
MSQFLQSITEPQRLQQTGRSPISNADTPVLSETAVLESLKPGEAIPCVVILTALQVEYMAVREYLTGLKEELHPQGTVYERGTFTTGQQIWDVVIAQIRAGNSGVATEVERAIARYSPRVILFVGVAGGVKKNLKIGDVVVGTKIYKYESGKALADRTLPRPTIGNSSYRLVQRAQTEARKSDWLAQIKSDRTDVQPSIYVEAIAAGEKVVASSRSPVCKFLREYYDDAYAVEMEGFGFLEAAWRNDDVSAIVIRGISDKLDKKAQADSTGSQKLAAAHASAFTFEMLSKLDGLTEVPLDEREDNVVQFQGDRLNIDLGKKPPETIAILRFQQNEDAYSLYAYHSQMKTLEETASNLTLPKQFGQFGTVDSWSLDTVGNLEDYQPQSCMIGQLLKWLRYLQRQQPMLTCLMIEEPLNSLVPWELLNLQGQPLGVVLQTVRSCPMFDDEMRENTQTIQSAGSCCEGPALIYLPMNAPEPINSYFPGVQIYAYESFSHNEPEQILVHLQSVEITVGLVVVADLALQQVSGGRRTAYLKRTKILREAGSMVMLQLAMGEDYGTGQRAVAAAFLEHGAKGVLGMLENMEGPIVRQIMNDFFCEYERDPGLPIPEIMRRLRVTIAQRLNDQLTDEMSQLYLATFMYGYYGHPMTVLQLTLASS